MPDYGRSQDELINRNAQQQMQSLAEAFRQQETIKAAKDAKAQEVENAKQETEHNIQRALELDKRLKGQGNYNINLSGTGGVSFARAKPDVNPYQQDLAAERHYRAKERAAKQLSESGLPAATQAFNRLEEVSPGAVSGKGEFKSAGGLKNLVPDFLVYPAEKLGLMPEGSSKERAAIQELSNVKVYDSSGKQINEKEMQRIMKAGGLSGVSDPSTIKQALQQMGLVVMGRNKTLQAGMRPGIQKELEEEGAVNTDKLGSILGIAPKQPAQAPQVQANSPEDTQAMQWLSANPSHPKAAAVKAKLMQKGLIK